MCKCHQSRLSRKLRRNTTTLGAGTRRLSWAAPVALDELAHLFFGGREFLADRRFENFVRDGRVDIAEGVMRFGVRAALDPATGDQRSQAVAFMRIGFGVLVDVD